MLFHVTGTIRDASKLAPFVEAEKRASAQLQESGFTLFAFRMADRPGVFMAVQAASHADAIETLDSLPFVAAGVMTLSIVEVLPA